MALTTIGIARLWARAFTDSKIINAWAEAYFSRPFSVRLGEDMRRPPDEAKAPFISLFPDIFLSGPQRAQNTHELGFAAGVLDEEWLDQNGVLMMRGLVRIEELCPMLEKAMRDALPKARLQEVEVEYEIVRFPLLLALGTVTVEESLPVGGRI